MYFALLRFVQLKQKKKCVSLGNDVSKQLVMPVGLGNMLKYLEGLQDYTV